MVFLVHIILIDAMFPLVIKRFWDKIESLLSRFNHWYYQPDAKVTQVDPGAVRNWCILFAVLMLLVLSYLVFRKRDEKCRMSTSHSISEVLLPSALIVWVAGVILYIVGFYNTYVTGMSVVLRAVVASFKMFVVANEMARVPSFLQNDALYMFFFAVIHFAAALISFLFIFKMIGYKIKASFDMMVHRMFHARNKTAHVFWGMNEASLLLAEDIHRTYENDTIIFVDIDQDLEDDTKKKSTLNRIINTITVTDHEITRLSRINALVAHCYNGPAALRSADNVSVFEMLGLNAIGAIVRKSKEAHFYILSDDEELNLATALVFQRDALLCCEEMKNRVTIYIHAHKDANNEVFDHYSKYNKDVCKLKMTVVDSSYLSIMYLKERVIFHPVNCVSYDADTGVVNSSFTSMVVGFGSTGQEAFKFLYEFATFIGKDQKKTPFKCYAVDEKMDKIEGLFRARLPKDIINDEELTLIKASVESEAFWAKIRETINDLNYVVIALNDDAIGLSVAVNLFKYALQHRSGDKKMLKLAVRSYGSDYCEKMKEVSRTLNESNAGANVELHVFGAHKDIFTCEVVKQDKVLREAKEFNRVYNDCKMSADDQWEADFGKDRLTHMVEVDGYSCYDAVYDINRKISQNISNSLHSTTKLLLMGLDAEGMSDRLKLYYGYVNSRKTEGVKYDRCDESAAYLLRNMAVLEHERWISAHKLLGFRYAEKSDFARKFNDCMCPLEQLDERTQSYDYKVIDTTVKILYGKA